MPGWRSTSAGALPCVTTHCESAKLQVQISIYFSHYFVDCRPTCWLAPATSMASGGPRPRRLKNCPRKMEVGLSAFFGRTAARAPLSHAGAPSPRSGEGGRRPPDPSPGAAGWGVGHCFDAGRLAQTSQPNLRRRSPAFRTPSVAPGSQSGGRPTPSPLRGEGGAQPPDTQAKTTSALAAPGARRRCIHRALLGKDFVWRPIRVHVLSQA